MKDTVQQRGSTTWITSCNIQVSVHGFVPIWGAANHHPNNIQSKRTAKIIAWNYTAVFTVVGPVCRPFPDNSSQRHAHTLGYPAWVGLTSLGHATFLWGLAWVKVAALTRDLEVSWTAEWRVTCRALIIIRQWVSETVETARTLLHFWSARLQVWNVRGYYSLSRGEKVAGCMCEHSGENILIDRLVT